MSCSSGVDVVQVRTAERLQRIQSLFDAGKTHSEVAKALGYSNINSYYRYIYKYGNNLNYNKRTLSITPQKEKKVENKVIKEVEAVPQPKENASKAESIISLISRGMDVREVAKTKRFKDTQELANYMKSKGYIWSSTEKNYVLIPQEKQLSPPETITVAKVIDDRPEQHENILKFLADNKDRLKQLLSAEKSVIPRYTLSGTSTSKTFNMVQPLRELIVEFSQEMNIHQKEILVVALIEFFRKYGYEEQVKYKLGL